MRAQRSCRTLKSLLVFFFFLSFFTFSVTNLSGHSVDRHEILTQFVGDTEFLKFGQKFGRPQPQ